MRERASEWARKRERWEEVEMMVDANRFWLHTFWFSHTFQWWPIRPSSKWVCIEIENMCSIWLAYHALYTLTECNCQIFSVSWFRSVNFFLYSYLGHFYIGRCGFSLMMIQFSTARWSAVVANDRASHGMNRISIETVNFIVWHMFTISRQTTQATWKRPLYRSFALQFG